MVDQRLVERVGPLSLDDGDHGHLADEAPIVQFLDGFAEGGAVAEVSPRHHHPVGHFPVALAQHLDDDGLLPFQPEGVDRIQQVDVGLLGDFLHQLHGFVEVSLQLQGQGSVVQALGQLSESDLLVRDEDHGLHAGASRIGGHGGRGVSRAGAGHHSGVQELGLGDSGSHAVVLEGPRGIQPLVLEVQLLQPRVICAVWSRVDGSVSLLHRHHLGIVAAEREQFPISPDAAEVEEMVGEAPLQEEMLDPLRVLEPEVVDHVHQASACRTDIRLRHGGDGVAAIFLNALQEGGHEPNLLKLYGKLNGIQGASSGRRR